MNNGELGRYSKRIVQYFWDPTPKNEDTAKIWCLGQSYESKYVADTDLQNHAHGSPPDSTVSYSSQTSTAGEESRSEGVSEQGGENTQVENADDGWPAPFLDDFESKIWLTYRSNFRPIPKSQDPRATSAMSFSVRLKSQFSQDGFTSDSGWGCMIRSGQNVLANTLLILRLGREWRRGQKSEEERRLLSLFADDPQAPFSIHRFVEHGASACGKHPGEWFGPSATARCIEALCENYEKCGLKVYITGDGSDVYEDKFFRVAKSSDSIFKPTLVLVGIRLGIDRVTPVYWEALKSSLHLPQSIGIAGGRPSSSHYFISNQGQYFFYLDPHFPRPFLPYYTNVASYSKEDIESCHTRRLRRIHIEEMDPSMLIAFLIKDEADWQEWKAAMRSVPGKAVVNIAESAPPAGGTEREEAINEVEAFDDDEDSDEGLQ